MKSILEKIFIEPSNKIVDDIDSKQAKLTSMLALFLTISINIGVVYMAFSTNKRVSKILAGAEVALFITYLISRTQYYHLAAISCISILCMIPILNVTFSSDYSSEALLILLIWNILTIVFSSALLSKEWTAFFIIINILTILLFPLLITNLSYTNIILPLSFNIVIPLSIFIFAIHRNNLETIRLNQILDMNNRLKKELDEKKEIQEQLVHSATHDHLTSLPNRAVLLDRIQHVISYFHRHEKQGYAVLFLDLDRFKIINDTLGHKAGDTILLETGKRLKKIIREQDTPARLGGDEFVVLLEDVPSITEVTRITNRILKSLSEPFELDNHNAHISASIGIVIGNKKHSSAEEILRNADIAMYRAKKKKQGSYEFFDSEMLALVKSRLEMEVDLRAALNNNEFILFYQPIIDVRTETLSGFEALIRWQHPQKGNISPLDFISIAEETGLIIPIGYWIIDTVCEQLKIWQKMYKPNEFAINVNLSNKQFQDKYLVSKLKASIEKHQIDPSCIKFELTESLIMEQSFSTSNTLSQFKKMGIQILIDDFGTGYSSLSYLHTLPIDILKIDKSFIHNMNESKKSIVRTIIELAHNLNMKVVAEGVETMNQYTMVSNMNCEYIQGFLISKPVDTDEAFQFLINTSILPAENSVDEN